MTDPAKTPRKGGQPASSSAGPSGSPRAGRRQTARHRAAAEPPTLLQRLRMPILVIVVVAAVAGLSIAVLGSAAAPAYACTTIDTVAPPAEGQLGQVQPDQGATHVQSGDRVTYPVCPPASGRHINRVGFGPLEPQLYGPDDASLPNGWIHNLEHGGLVLLYSCDRGACEDEGIQALRDVASGFPDSAICSLPAGVVGPVVARFEQMPTKYAALVWNRALYLDTLDAARIYDFYTRYGERVEDGKFITPPEPQCLVPSASPAGG